MSMVFYIIFKNSVLIFSFFSAKEMKVYSAVLSKGNPMTINIACLDGEIYTLKSNITAGEALKELDAKGVRSMPVVEDGQVMGVFSVDSVIQACLPKAISQHDVWADVQFMHDSNEETAEKWREVSLMPLADVMRTDIKTVKSDANIIEGLFLLHKFGSPLCVVDADNGRFQSIITKQSMLKALQKFQA